MAAIATMPEIRLTAFPDGHQVTTAWECESRNGPSNGVEQVVYISVQSAMLACTCGWWRESVPTSDVASVVTEHGETHTQ